MMDSMRVSTDTVGEEVSDLSYKQQVSLRSAICNCSALQSAVHFLLDQEVNGSQGGFPLLLGQFCWVHHCIKKGQILELRKFSH